MGEKYDFIIVGGGAAGAVIAARLSQAATRPKVLLLESGPDTRQLESDTPDERMSWIIRNPQLDQGYSSVSEAGLNGRKLKYLRGRGLGGSTVINFRFWTYGPASDYDRWAEIVGDEMFRWENVGGKFKKMEKLHINLPTGMDQFLNPDLGSHGDSGPIDVCLPLALEKEFPTLIEAAEEIGISRNLDINSGNPIGVSNIVNTADEKNRTTSATAYLSNTLENLDIWTDSKVARVLFENKKAIGVELADGRKAFCNKEVIISGGAIDSPKLLLLSGIGPTTELKAHNIETIHNLPGIGKNLQEHLGTHFINRASPEFSDRWVFESSPTAAKEAARKQWAETQTGPLKELYSNSAVSFIKLPALYDTLEFQALDPKLQSFLREDSVPHYELLTGSRNYSSFDFGSDSYLCTLGICMNMQSRGSITLASANPNDAPLIHFNFLTHPYDRRVMIEGVKEMQRYFKTQALAPYLKEPVLGPASYSDDDIIKFAELDARGSFHASCTVKMGRAGDKNACVDSRFRVFGVEGLRVADMSVCPELTNNHSQATAYLIGELAADVLIADYCLG